LFITNSESHQEVSEESDVPDWLTIQAEMFRFYFALIVFVFVAAQVHCKPQHHPLTNPRAWGHITKDLQDTWMKMRQKRDRLRTIYLEEADVLKPEKVKQAKVAYYHFVELCHLAMRLIREYRLAYVKDTALLKVLEEQVQKLRSEVSTYAHYIANMHPLDLYARNFNLKPGRVLEYRKFFNKKTDQLVTGKELIAKLKEIYRQYHLKTKTSLNIAREWLETMVEEVPDFLPAHFWLAKTYFDLEMIKESDEVMKTLMQVDPTLRIASSLDAKLLTEDDLLEAILPEPENAIPQHLPEVPEPIAYQEEGVQRVPYVAVLKNSEGEFPNPSLNLAPIVMEVPSGHGTSFLAFFGSSLDKSNPIGPLTGVEPHMLESLFPFNAVVLHDGASHGGIKKRSQLMFDTLDASSVPAMFFRRGDYHPPENQFFRLDRLVEMAYSNGLSPGNLWNLFYSDATGSPYHMNRVRAVHVPIAQDKTVSYFMKKELGKYARLYNGVHQKISKEEPLLYQNVVVLYMDVSLQDDGFPMVDVFGDGELDCFVGGRHYKGSWQRDKLESEFLLFDEDKNRIALFPGKTVFHWVPRPTIIRIDNFETAKF